MALFDLSYTIGISYIKNCLWEEYHPCTGNNFKPVLLNVLMYNFTP